MNNLVRTVSSSAVYRHWRVVGRYERCEAGFGGSVELSEADGGALKLFEGKREDFGAKGSIGHRGRWSDWRSSIPE